MRTELFYKDEYARFEIRKICTSTSITNCFTDEDTIRTLDGDVTSQSREIDNLKIESITFIKYRGRYDTIRYDKLEIKKRS